MWASNFGRTNLPSGIIYAFATTEEANNQFDLLLQDEAGEGYTEDDRENYVYHESCVNYTDTIDYLKEILPMNNYSSREWIWEKKIIGYVNVNLYNKESKQWEDGSINIIVENGYHDGARFDIDLDDLYDNFPPLNKSQTSMISRELRRIEKAFAEVCNIKLKRVWGFSNGESVYEAV